MAEAEPRKMIEARGLCRYYRDFVAIRDISFAIPEGQIVAFLGPNGAGKTTTMKILAGFLAPSSGSAVIAGADVQRDRLTASRHLGYLPENGPLYGDMTPLELLGFFAEARQLPAEDVKPRIEAISAQCALDEVLDKPIGKLSRGYRQRVGLAQALLHDPAVLIMDEPTAGLDPNQIRDFRDNIRELGKSKTVLISTHILQEVDAVADRVLFVHEGRLIFDGAPAELREEGSLEQPFYRLTHGGKSRAATAAKEGVMLGVNARVVWSLVKRDLRMYFTNPTGYVFITLFIFLSAAAAFWQERFFLNNLANLDQLNGLLPSLLVLFVPALTMAVWSEERKQGTDELLLTLPATDFEIVLGKYKASVTIYSVALVLSLSHVLVLLWLGSPDLGLMLSNYLGYWLLGAALIAAGMLASLLTANTTVAFILGAAFCALLVWGDSAAGLFSEGLARSLATLGPRTHFADFARGVVHLRGIVYFASLAGFFLYMNVLLLGRRHWPREADGIRMSFQQAIRAIALGVALIAVNVTLGRSPARIDLTAERLHSLSPETVRLVGELDPERPVFIQAFVSPDIPEAYVQTRANLLGVLAEIDAEAGQRVQVLVEETEPYTETARAAREKFGITSRQVPNLRSARAGFSNVFLGFAVTCGAAEQVTPFLDRGLPVEYELVRSIRVVARTERKRIGVVQNDLRLFGGLDFNTMRSTPAWSVVDELEKQYEVVRLRAQEPIEEDLDGLLVLLPSLLPQPEMDNVLARIESGTPTLVLVDPLPLVNPALAPSEQAGADRNPFMRQGQPPPTPKGDINGFLRRLGVRWNKGRIVWDSYNPHPDLAHLPEEVVFVGEGSQAEQPFHPESRASNTLQELVLLYPGHLEPIDDSGFSFTPLLNSGRVSGRFEYQQMVRRSFFGTSIEQRLRHEPDAESYVLAAHVAATPVDSEEDEDDATLSSGEEWTDVQVIVVADVDFISEQFFAIRRTAPRNLSFDNVTLFLNAMDVLVGDDSFIDLRNRRVAHRTLERVEERTREFIVRRTAEEQEAEAEADKALSDAQERLDQKVAAVRQRTDLDTQAKSIMARNLEQVERRRLDVLKANIEAAKQAKIQRSREDMEAQIRSIQSGIRTSAVLIPPIPVFVLGVLIFIRRYRRERAGAAAAHRLRS